MANFVLKPNDGVFMNQSELQLAKTFIRVLVYDLSFTGNQINKVIDLLEVNHVNVSDEDLFQLTNYALRLLSHD